MTKTSEAQQMTTTMTENPAVCYFCQGVPVAIKRDATLVGREDADGTVLDDGIAVELLPICEACDTEWYDGTEMFPALLPLDTRP